MKKQGIAILVVITLLFLSFTLGLFIGRKQTGNGIQVFVSDDMQTVPPQITIPEATDSPLVNINTATKEELMALPGIGEDLAQRILAYRKAMVAFSAPEELINVEGIGEKVLENILHLITIGG